MTVCHVARVATIVCEWGLAGIEAHRDAASVFVIVDVLSFSTATSVAVERGAAVIPFAHGDSAAAQAEAERQGAALAASRRAGGGQLSLSPVSLQRLAAGTRLLLPSPNGSRLSLATGDAPTIAGCLRNATAVARLATDLAGGGTVAVIPAGERWPDGTLRPAIEDWLGAGAIIAALGGDLRAEAELAAATYRNVGTRLTELVRDSGSGRELARWGFTADVDVALEVDASAAVPILRERRYVAA